MRILNVKYGCLYVPLFSLEAEGHLDEATSHECAAGRIQYIDDEVLVSESGKMAFLVDLLDNLKAEGHRCLIFSQSRKVLDIIQKVLRTRVSTRSWSWVLAVKITWLVVKRKVTNV